MPRRKKARKNQTSRMRPVLPEGDLDSSMSIDERKAKLDIYLKDLNMQVQERVEKMKARGYDMICKVKGAFSLEILKLPMNIRKMKLCDYRAQGGEVNETALNEASKLVTEMTRSVLQPTTKATTRDPFTELGNLPLKTPSGIKVKSEDQTGNVKLNEPGFLEPTTAPRSLRPRKRKDMSPSTVDKNTRSAKTRKTKDSITVAPPSTGKRTSKRIQPKAHFATPAVRGIPYSNTPMVTPKFDPRLPVTPALLREPKVGESIMSLNGSPIVNSAPASNTPQLSISLGNGRRIQLNPTSHLSPSQSTILNDAARKNVELLQQKLSQLLAMPTPAEKK